MEKFYLGMDIGTDSVGIACTDENYRLLRAKGKDLWAVRLFEEANTALERRTKRVARRRYQRRAQRIRLLQELFAPYLEDELFFLRLNHSGFVFEDKDSRLQSADSLFADKNFHDKEFHKAFPTVFHLRKSLIEGKQKADLRLYYLAIHHIVKYRGHFLFEGQGMSEVRDARRLFEELKRVSEEVFAENAPDFDPEKAAEFRRIALECKDRDREKKVWELFGVREKREKEIVKLMLGYKGKPWDIFENEDYKEEKSISFREMTEEDFEAKQSVYGEDFEYLCVLKKIYDFLLFERVLGGNKYISNAMTSIYDKHRADLRRLKDLILNELSHEEYVRMFKSREETNNYAHYVGYTKVGKSKEFLKKCKREDFYKYLKNLLKDLTSEEAKTVLAEVEAQNFLPKILNADNGLFPFQVNGDELSAILSNLVRDYPAFGEKDEDGLSVAKKIEAVFRFRIPYYVGPLNTYHADKGGNSWAVRKQEGRITPWNFDRMIDRAASNEKFMNRMIGRCSYLHEELALPKCSILFQRYNTLNQLNNWKINEKPISVRLKQELFRDLFLQKGKVRKKDIEAYLQNRGEVPVGESVALGGFDGEITASMSSYHTLKKILGDFVDRRPDVCEKIILWHTLNTDKNLVERLLVEHYGNLPEIRENLKRIKGITSFKDFATLSEKFLCGIEGGIDDATGEVYTVLGQLYNTNQNLNQILYDDKYTFRQAIEAENGKDSEVDYETLREMRLSPQVRRGVWQSLRMAEEYVAAVGRAPDKIFVEVTRGKDSDPKRTESRKTQIAALYEQAKELKEFNAKLNHELEEKSNLDLRSERLYLYFMQLGKCAYSGETIDLGRLNSDLYDVDHILPRSMTKDDSLDNKVLVLREKNARKTDRYPVPEEYRFMREFWKVLKDKHLMSEKKYGLLTRTEPLNEDDLNQFINRQLVVTGQTAKAVAELMKRIYGNSGAKVVFSKAKNVDDFKNKFGIFKCRETNDLHHARDAYLNVVVGNVYDTKFTSARDYFYRKPDDTWREYSLKTLFDRAVPGAWDPERSLATVKEILQKPSMTVTRFAFANKSGFYDETIYRYGEREIAAPRKECAPYQNTERYGGFSKLKTAYFAVVRSTDKKGKTMKTIEAIPVLIEARAKSQPDAVMKYLTESVGLTNPEILIKKLLVKTLIEVDGTPVWLAGMTGSQLLVHNAVQWFSDSRTDQYVRGLVRLKEMKINGQIKDHELENSEFWVKTNRLGEKKQIVEPSRNLELYEAILQKLGNRVYGGISGFRAFRETLSKHLETFRTLTCLEQTEILLQSIKVLKCNAETADLSLFGEGKGCGKLRINKDITDKKIVVVHRSPCGLTERRRKI